MKHDKCMALMQEKLAELQPTHLEIQDDGAHHVGHAHEGAGHFTVKISSPLFVEKSLVKKHQMIYAALGDLMKDDIHALRIIIL